MEKKVRHFWRMTSSAPFPQQLYRRDLCETRAKKENNFGAKRRDGPNKEPLLAQPTSSDGHTSPFIPSIFMDPPSSSSSFGLGCHSGGHTHLRRFADSNRRRRLFVSGDAAVQIARHAAGQFGPPADQVGAHRNTSATGRSTFSC